MSAPILAFTGFCFGKIPEPSKSSNRVTLGDKVLFASIFIDALVSITALVIGILGFTGVIPMVPAAAYGLISVSGGITLLWIALVASKIFCRDAVGCGLFGKNNVRK